MSGVLPEGRNEAVRGLSLDVELEAVPADDVVSGEPRQGITELGGIGGVETGIWELRGGVVTDTETDELFVVLSGGARIELLEVPGHPEETGRTVEVGPGDVMRLVAGTRTRWSVEDHIRKVYIAAE
ncbi:cupin domain-containing protein [Leucobacter tenebrionis]|uniref:cupin domain-containing protein n=1 Tax=Leucobacter tenebrionis TaxID=2873270 RepID=UPI001CA6D259|nr:cupin domain-containing protein [Leucobacter tenebrionis]QZY52881.1 cupin domain-containing protein [Leucobacter tenebrionis]